MVYISSFKSPPDNDDLIFEHIAYSPLYMDGISLPKKFDWLNYILDPRDQGNRACCAAFAAASVSEVINNQKQSFENIICEAGKKKHKSSNDIKFIKTKYKYLSPEFIYYHRKNKPTNGMCGRDAFQILKRIGSVPEYMYPYHINDEFKEKLNKPNSLLYKIAKSYRIHAFAKIDSMEGLRRAVYQHGPCYILLPMFNYSKKFWKNKSRLKMIGHHALTVFGYDEDGFILRNSWDKTWNKNGYTLLPYDEWNYVIECWTALDNNYNKDLSKTIEKKQNYAQRQDNKKKCLLL